MQTTKSKTQTIQLPSQVVAVIKSPFNPDLPSSLTKDRINELNHLALKATIDDRRPVGNKIDNHYLLMEAFAIEELCKALLDVDGDTIDFYYHINSAFKMLLQDRPREFDSVFSSYSKLTNILRLIEKHQKYINIKLNDTQHILFDMDALDEEGNYNNEQSAAL